MEALEQISSGNLQEAMIKSPLTYHLERSVTETIQNLFLNMPRSPLHRPAPSGDNE
jgi:hypothetical protein